MDHINITMRKDRSTSLPFKKDSTDFLPQQTTSTSLNDLWLDSSKLDAEPDSQEVLSPPITAAVSKKSTETLQTNVPFSQDQLDYIQLLMAKQNQELNDEITNLKNELKEKNDLIVQIEKDVIDLQQYIRRNNVEIHGIPDNVEQKDLEKKVIEVCSALNVHIKKQDIEACHRLEGKTKGNAPKKTIVRFVNRKVCDDLHRNKKVLKDGGNRNVRRKFHNLGMNHATTFINNNLCPYNKFLWGKCKQLHTAKLIDKFWVFNGHIFINDDLNQNNRGTKITHFNELKQNFPGFDFKSKFT